MHLKPDILKNTMNTTWLRAKFWRRYLQQINGDVIFTCTIDNRSLLIITDDTLELQIEDFGPALGIDPTF